MGGSGLRYRRFSLCDQMEKLNGCVLVWSLTYIRIRVVYNSAYIYNSTYEDRFL